MRLFRDGNIHMDRVLCSGLYPVIAAGLGYLSLEAEPVVVQVPDFGDRFWTLPVYDARTDQISELGLQYGTKPGFYMVVGPNWKGATPPGVAGVVRSSTNSVRCEPPNELRRHWRRPVGGTFQPGDLAAFPVDDQARRNATGVHDADRGALGDQEYRQPGDSVLLKEGQPAVVPQILTQNALLSELDRGQYNVFAKRH